MEQLIKFILSFESGVRPSRFPGATLPIIFEHSRRSGFSNHPDDPGGATMCGMTLKTYRAWCRSKAYPVPSVDDLRNIPCAHWCAIFRENFWDYVSASQMQTPSHAWLIVDWVWASGPKVLKSLQKILGVKADGIIGPLTIAAINSADPATLFKRIRAGRTEYIDRICTANPKLQTFRKGWLRRLDSIKFDKLIEN